MKIEDLLQKPNWKRRLPPRLNIHSRRGKVSMAAMPMQFDNGRYIELTQNDFLNELYASSHLVNSVDFRSNRIKYKYNPDTKKNEEDGYEDVSRISFSLQEAIRRHKVTHTFGNPMWFGSEGKDERNDQFVALFGNHWNITGMTDALNSVGQSLFGTGDAGLYIYRKDDEINYKVFSFENGDNIVMHRDFMDRKTFVRSFMYKGHKAVEIYDDKNISFWIKSDAIEQLIEFKDAPTGEKSEDDYVLMRKEDHGNAQCPVVYFRVDDVPWGPGQTIIEHIEDLSSDLSENNKYYAYQILFLTGGVMNLPPAGKMGKVIASKSPDGKAEILKPADASNTFSIDLENSKDMLWETTGTVVVDPKELKAGENTGAFIKNLYWRELQWSANMIAYLRPSLKELVDIFKDYVRKIESFNTDKIKMSFILEPFIPKNTTEEVNNICNAVNSGITSIATGSVELPLNNPREVDLLKKEREEEAELEVKKTNTGTKKQTEPQPPDNEGLLTVDNKAKS